MGARSPLGRVLATATLIILVGSLGLAPDRFFLLPFAVAGMALALLSRRPLGWCLLILPWVALLNLHPWRSGSGALYPSEAVLLAAFAALFWRGWAVWPGRRAGGGAVGWTMAVFAGWTAVAALVAGLSVSQVEPGDVLRQLRLAALAGGGFAVGWSAGVGSGRRFAGSSAAWVGWLGLAVAAEMLLGGAVRGVPQVGRLVGGSELLAIHLTLLLPLSLGVALAPATGRVGRLTGWIGMLLALMALGISFSRSGWVGGWAGLLTVAALAWWRNRGTWSALVAILLLAVALVVGLVLTGLVQPPGVPAAYLERLQSLGAGDLVGDRAAEWQRGLDAIRQWPIFGHPAAENCYNLLLQLGARSGVPALLACVALLAVVVVGLRKGVWEGTRDSGVLAAGLAGAIIGLLVTGIGESSLGTRIMPVAMTVAGLAAAQVRLDARRTTSGVESVPAASKPPPADADP